MPWMREPAKAPAAKEAAGEGVAAGDAMRRMYE